MNGLYAAALELQQFFQMRDWRFCIIGALALVRWGQPRATHDVDVSLLTGFGEEPRYVDELLAKFAGRLANAREFALENRVLLAQATNGTPLDIALAAFPYEERVIARASPFTFAPEVTLITASGEDLVVLKAFAARDQDWVDVGGIVERQASRLDWGNILKELALLCEIKEDQSPLNRLEEMQKKAKTDNQALQPDG
jgi:hypothetical protein